MVSDIPQSTAYLSKKLVHTVQRWTACLRAVAATCDISLEAEKLSLGQPITVYAPHQVLSLLQKKDICGRNVPSNFSQQSQHLPQNCNLNPASLLLEPASTTLMHDRAEVLDKVNSSRIDLQNCPLEETDWT